MYRYIKMSSRLRARVAYTCGVRTRPLISLRGAAQPDGGYGFLGIVYYVAGRAISFIAVGCGARPPRSKSKGATRIGEKHRSDCSPVQIRVRTQEHCRGLME
jgi:hypothetical protein